MARGFEVLRVEFDQQELDQLFDALPSSAANGLNQEQFVASIRGELPWFSTSKKMMFAFREMVLKARMFREMFGVFDREGEGEIGTDAFGSAITMMFGWRPTR